MSEQAGCAAELAAIDERLAELLATKAGWLKPKQRAAIRREVLALLRRREELRG